MLTGADRDCLLRLFDQVHVNIDTCVAPWCHAGLVCVCVCVCLTMCYRFVCRLQALPQVRLALVHFFSHFKRYIPCVGPPALPALLPIDHWRRQLWLTRCGAVVWCDQVL